MSRLQILFVDDLKWQMSVLRFQYDEALVERGV